MNIQITIDGADETGANYITWSPVHGSIRLAEADGGAAPVDVLLRNKNPNSNGGQIIFRNAIREAAQNTLQLRLPADGSPVDLFVAGKFEHPSVEDKDAVIEVVEADTGNVLSTKALMVRIRKNANNLTEDERDRFLSTLAELNDRGMGQFSDFRSMHTNAGSPEAHGRVGFLPWHRAYVLDLERELQQIDPSVALPYWKFDEPAPKLFHREFIGVPNANWGIEFVAGNPLEFWVTDTLPGIVRIPFFNTERQPAFVRSELQTMTLGGDENLYADFIREMEGDPHGVAHGNFGGFLQVIHFAAKDPLFFLLHANVDRLWAKWQWQRLRFDAAKPATYPFLGSAGDPNSERVGHNLNDTMWPWNQSTTPPRPVTAPGGALAASPTTNAPGSMPRVGDMIDYQGVINQGNRLGFDYDDVRFEFLPPGP